jgi:endonuclease YncB( thermonuclease family)
MFRPRVMPHQISPAARSHGRLRVWLRLWPIVSCLVLACAAGVVLQARFGLLRAADEAGMRGEGARHGAQRPASSLPGASAEMPATSSPSQAWRGQVLRVIDGDTIEARVQTWPGQEVVTLVRLRGIDTPELAGGCPQEKLRAEEARGALTALIGGRGIVVCEVGPDKFYGRVVARVVTADGIDAGQALLEQGLARFYARGQRGNWCQTAGARSSG